MFFVPIPPLRVPISKEQRRGIDFEKMSSSSENRCWNSIFSAYSERVISLHALAAPAHECRE